MVASVIALFAALATTDAGALTQLPGPAGCVGSTDVAARFGCAPLRGVGGGHPALDLVASPDNRFVYVAYGRGIATLARAQDGSLQQLAGADGCLDAEATDGCGPLRGVGAPSIYPDLEATSDGRTLFLTTTENHPGTVIAAFARDPASGRLSQLPGAAGCLAETAANGCTALPALRHRLEELVVTPDGRTLYAGGSGRLHAFARDPGRGTVRSVGGRDGCVALSSRSPCARVAEPFLITKMTLSGDGRFLYVNSAANCELEFEPCLPGALWTFARDQRSGALSRRGCLREGRDHRCAPARSLFWPVGIASSPDGRHVYTGGGTIAAFAREGGALTQLPGRRGCVGGSRRCARLRGVRHPTGITVAPDGRNVYVGIGFNDGTIGVLARDPATGALRQLPGARGCLAARRRGCARVRISEALSTPVVSPDGRFVYLTGSAMVAVFARG